MLSNSEAEHLQAARLALRNIPPSANPLWRGERYGHRRIRIAYVSTDLRRHATSHLMVGCFENHDRNRFETTAISLFPGDGTEMRKRVEAAFDHFLDVDAMSDIDVAKLMREHEIDIAVDLNGLTRGTRTRIFSYRPAPIQVNFVGYPGTMGTTFMDYIIADHIVIPEENRVHYSEKAAYLPYSYQPNDSKRPIAEKVPTRKEAGLPEHGFVFTCLNNPAKIRPHIFDVWMRLLADVDGSVLWLLDGGPSTTVNLRREARLRGVDPERLVMARKMDTAAHLARQVLGDLFLDTDPCNAHTTASDALWVGLPVLSLMGKAFPGRVAASLLYAMELPELVTHSLGEYERLALSLARDPRRLSAIKTKLVRNRETTPLFDTALFTRHLEAAFTTMWQRCEAGQEPVSFSVPPL
jgi:predicted O-linked N-acetylglucosamine transferase (SPINDLY family)